MADESTVHRDVALLLWVGVKLFLLLLLLDGAETVVLYQNY